MLGLGNSVGTPPEGIEAPLVVVSGFEELESRRAEAAGSIVLINVPYTDYFSTVGYRTTAASRVGRVGAIAALVRSVGLDGLRTPHTGVMMYQGDGPRIPAAAVSVEDAMRLARLTSRGAVRLRLVMGAQMLPDAQSSNVVAEIRGREKPDEIVLVGGALRFLGRRHGCDRRWRRVHRDVGSLAADARAEPSSAADGARRAVRERGEWTPRGARLSRPTQGGAAQSRPDAGVRQRRVSTARVRIHGRARGAWHAGEHRAAASMHRRRSHRSIGRWTRHRPERGDGADSRDVARH